jgi:dienelactone hydrolase
MNFRLATIAPIAMLVVAAAVQADERFSGPWDIDSLQQVPDSTWGKTTEPAEGVVLKEVFYEGVPYSGKPTRVFAYYARPKDPVAPLPGMVLVHGGGGAAFAEWATLWARRGYAALAMDTAGNGPGRSRLPDGGPNQSHTEKFAHIADHPLKDMWTYHAVAAAIRGHSLLASFDEVDADRIGITGISWGGYLTCIVTGLDDRLKVSVPVYGCGFLHDNSCWLGEFERMTPELRQTWVQNFDPSRYLPHVSCPILFVNGTNDFAYPLDSYQKSYRAVPGRTDLCVTVRMPHGHQAGWAPAEIGLFVDSVLRDGVPLPRLSELRVDGATAVATCDSRTAIATAQLHFAKHAGPWKERAWSTIEARIDGDAVRADLPADRPLVCFVTVTDDRGATTSTAHLVLAK